MPLLHHPLPSATEAVLRRAVLQHCARGHRRAVGPVLHVGSPGGAEASYAAGLRESVDHAVRTDVVAALLRRIDEPGVLPLVWLARTGEHSLHDVDAAWLAAAEQAFGEAGRPLTLVVVTRQGWWDPRSGTRRVWKRLRAR